MFTKISLIIFLVLRTSILASEPKGISCNVNKFDMNEFVRKYKYITVKNISLVLVNKLVKSTFLRI